MSYTNQTSNYALPQYESDDKPTYLGDFNKAMLDIDTNMKTIESKAISAESNASSANATAQSAQSIAQSAQSTADSAQATATQAQTSVTQAQSTADTAKSTADTAKSTADTANTLAEKINRDINNWITSDIKNNLSNIAVSKIIYNKYLKLLQLIGSTDTVGEPGVSNFKVGILPEDIRPKSDITIKNACSVFFLGGQGWQVRDILIKSNGEIVMPSVAASVKITSAKWNIFVNISDTNNWNVL